MRSRPDVLVLGGGGVLGEAWMMGVLAGIEDATGFDLRDCDYYVGTSAGAIVAAHLASGQSPRRPSSFDGDEGSDMPSNGARPVDGLAAAGLAAVRRAGSWAMAAAATFAPMALGLAAPGGAVARALLLRRLPRPTSTLTDLHRSIDRLDPGFDGRLRIAAVDRGNGRRVMFGSPGAPRTSVADAVAASCTVPWLFAPVTIAGREYVDGGVWSPTNLDAAPAGRDTHVLCLNPTANIPGSSGVLAVVRRVSRTAVTVESLALRRRGAAVQMLAPNQECTEIMGTDFLDREPRGRVLAAAYRQGLAFVTASVPVSQRPPQPSLPRPRP